MKLLQLPLPLLLLESQLELVAEVAEVATEGQVWQHQISQLLSGHEIVVDVVVEAHGIGVEGLSGHKRSPESFKESELLSESFPSLSSIG
jgi:hypothetical protein